MQPVDLGKVYHNLAVHHQVVEAHPGAQFVHLDEVAPLLVGDVHSLEHHLVEWRDAQVVDGDIGLEELA